MYTFNKIFIIFFFSYSRLNVFMNHFLWIYKNLNVFYCKWALWCIFHFLDMLYNFFSNKTLMWLCNVVLSSCNFWNKHFLRLHFSWSLFTYFNKTVIFINPWKKFNQRGHFNRVFKRINPVIEIVKMAGRPAAERVPLLYE